MIRVLVVDDEQLLRESLVRMVEAADDLTVIGAVPDGATAVSAVAGDPPDVVLMDIRMPVMDGVEATRRIVAANPPGRSPGPRVLILTTYDLDSYVYAALRAGASGFLLKDAPGERIRDGIRVVAGGHSVLAPEATTRMIKALQPSLPTADDHALLEALGHLTEREREVCELIATGLSNHEIAERLVISRHTVKIHVSNILTKLGLPDRVQVVLAWSRLRPDLHRAEPSHRPSPGPDRASPSFVPSMIGDMKVVVVGATGCSRQRRAGGLRPQRGSRTATRASPEPDQSRLGQRNPGKDRLGRLCRHRRSRCGRRLRRHGRGEPYGTDHRAVNTSVSLDDVRFKA